MLKSKKKMKKSLIVLSGGMDSVTLLYDRKDDIAMAVTFDYGSNHSVREIECAKFHCEQLGVEHLIIPLDFMRKYFKSALLSGAENIPTGDYDVSNMKSTVVPFRNGIMLSIAVGLAESYQLNNVLIANHFGDHDIYPDCTTAFIESITSASINGTYLKVGIDAPYTNLSKTDIALIGAKLNIDYSKTYSCYKGAEKHCGKCATCIERIEALKAAGINDLTIYE
jgi:7-cyano-7-deazaguanine synthase